MIKAFQGDFSILIGLPWLQTFNWQDVESDSWLQSDLEEELVNLREEEQEQEHPQDILNLLPLVQCN